MSSTKEGNFESWVGPAKLACGSVPKNIHHRVQNNKTIQVNNSISCTGNTFHVSMRYENFLWSEAVGNRSTLEKLALNVSMFRSLQQNRGADALQGQMGRKRSEGSAGSLKTSPQVLCAYLSTSPQTSHSVVYKECKRIPVCPLRLCVSPEPERLLRWPLYDFTLAWDGFVCRFLLSLSMFSGYVFLFSVTWPLSILSLALLVNLLSLPGSNLKLHVCAPRWVRWTLFFTSFYKKKRFHIDVPCYYQFGLCSDLLAKSKTLFICLHRLLWQQHCGDFQPTTTDR